MIECPRCGDLVDGLEPLPVESVRNRALQESIREGGDVTEACRWCRQELLEE